MSVESLSSDLAQVRLQQEAQTAVLSKTLDEFRSQGENLQKLIDSASLAPPVQDQNTGNRIDLLA